MTRKPKKKDEPVVKITTDGAEVAKFYNSNPKHMAALMPILENWDQLFRVINEEVDKDNASKGILTDKAGDWERQIAERDGKPVPGRGKTN